MGCKKCLFVGSEYCISNFAGEGEIIMISCRVGGYNDFFGGGEITMIFVRG